MGDCALFSQQPVEVGRADAVFPVPQLLFHAPPANKIAKGALYGGSGLSKIRRNGTDGIPTFPVSVGVIVEIHTDRLGAS